MTLCDTEKTSILTKAIVGGERGVKHRSKPFHKKCFTCDGCSTELADVRFRCREICIGSPSMTLTLNYNTSHLVKKLISFYFDFHFSIAWKTKSPSVQTVTWRSSRSDALWSVARSPFHLALNSSSSMRTNSTKVRT